MYYLFEIRDLIMQDERKLVAYSLMFILFIVLIVSSILILRLDKLRLVLKFIIIFFKKDSTKDNMDNF